MAERERVQVLLTLDEDAAALLRELAGGPRKQGEYLSTLIRRIAAEKRAAGLADDVQTLRQQLQALEARVGRLMVFDSENR